MEEEENKSGGEVNADALEAAFGGDEVIIEEEEILFIEGDKEGEDEDDVDLAFHEDEGYW